jgi:hypothetical protein
LVRRARSKRIDKSQALKYAQTGRYFLESARALSEIADDGAPYGNAIALNSIHAAISFADSLTIAFGERKSGDQHEKAIDVLRTTLGSKIDEKMAKAFVQILQQKDTVSYQGSYYSVGDGRKVLKRAESFCKWASDVFETRP